MKIIFNIIFILSVFSTTGLWAQTSPADSLVSLGDRLRDTYRFRESVEAYSKALETPVDTADLLKDSVFRMMVSDRLLLAENGMNMAAFAYVPSVVARHRFSLDDFFLYYPLKDRSWRRTPNQLDSMSGPYAKALYAPSEDKDIYFSAVDPEGIRNIYRTRLADTVWTVPALLNEQMVSASDEIYPMMSQDGKSIYFASEGLYGVGGYDLYVSHWDESEKDWSVPVNMGFPYSSPANDFLLINTEDGKYTIFASDRGCPEDSVCVYVLEYDSVPVRGSIDDPQELIRISMLEPSSHLTGKGEEVKSEIPENVDTRRYMDKMAQVRALRDSIAACENAQAQDRELYSMTSSETEKRKLAERILKNESLIPVFRSHLDKAVKQLQDIEMDFLFSGVVIDPDNLLAEAEREVVAQTPDYVFSKMDMGEPLTLEMEKTEPEFDYSFRILEEGQLAEDNTLPQGIVYQIQMFTTGTKAVVKSLKGLSPVFESRSSSGRYIYRVGLFTSYDDVLSKLNTVKKLGFRSAYVVGFVDGSEMPVGKVRAIEQERKAVRELYRVTFIPAGGELDTVAMEGIRQQVGQKDIARTEGGFMIGPFDSRTDAVALVEFIEVMGYGDASLDVISKE